MADVQSNEVPFAVLEDEETPPRIGLEVEIYAHDDPNRRIDVIPDRWEVSSLDEIGKPGGGSFSMWRYDEKLTEERDPDLPGLLDWRNIVRLKLNHQTVGAFLIQNKEADIVSREEISGESWKITGEGLRSWFKDAVVLPYGGLKAKSAPQRVFSFASEQGAWYKPEDWSLPVNIQQHNLDPNPGPWGTAPAQWPDAPDAWWVWGQYNDAATPAPAGYNFFRYEFDIAEGVGTKQYSVFAAGDNQMVAYLDAQEIITADENDSWTRTWRGDVELDPGHHVLAFRVLNSGTSPAALIAALFRAGDAATETPAVLLTTTGQAGWLVNPYPDPAPGWTAGEIMLTLLAEAEARGVRFPGFLNPTFTAETDSHGEAWTRALDWNFGIGTEYYEVVERLEEAVCDLWIDPGTLALNMYVQRGTDRTQQSQAVTPIKFEIARNIMRAHEEGTSDIKNTLTLGTTDGWLLQSDALTDSIATYGRVEGNLSTGLSPDVSGDVAVAVFAMKAIPSMASTYDVIDTDDARPYVDFGVGDYVLAPNEAGEPTPIRILSMSTAENQKTGQPVYALEFGTITDDIATRHERWLKSISNAALGGSVVNAGGGGGGGSGANPAQATQDGPQGPQGPAGPPGMDYRGEWSDAIEYAALDAVTFDGQTWISNVSDNLDSEPADDNDDWDLLAARGSAGPAGPAGPGIVYKGTWSDTTEYVTGDLVLYDGLYYIANEYSLDEQPDTSASWDEYTGGGGGGTGANSEFKGLWVDDRAYLTGDQVVYGTEQFKALRNSTDETPGVPFVPTAYTYTGPWGTANQNFATAVAMQILSPTTGTYTSVRVAHAGAGRVGFSATKPGPGNAITWLAYADVTGSSDDRTVALNMPMVIAPGTAEVWAVWYSATGGNVRNPTVTTGWTDSGGTSQGPFVGPNYSDAPYTGYRILIQAAAPIGGTDAWLKIYDLPAGGVDYLGAWDSTEAYVAGDVVVANDGTGEATWLAVEDVPAVAPGIFFVGATSVSAPTTAVVALSLPVPSGTLVGDYQVVSVTGFNGYPPAMPGWTLLGRNASASASSGSSVAVYGRVAPDLVTVTTPLVYNAAMSVYRNLDPASVTVLHDTFLNSLTSPAVTTTLPWVARFWNVQAASAALTSPAGVSRFTAERVAGNNISTYVSDETPVSGTAAAKTPGGSNPGGAATSVTLGFDASNTAFFVPGTAWVMLGYVEAVGDGMQYASDWNEATSYVTGDVVRVGLDTYVALEDHPAAVVLPLYVGRSAQPPVPDGNFTSVSIPAPAGLEVGDIEFLSFFGWTNYPAAPPGWTLLAQDASATLRASTYWRVATDTAAVTRAAPDYLAAERRAYRNVDTSTIAALASVLNTSTFPAQTTSRSFAYRTLRVFSSGATSAPSGGVNFFNHMGSNVQVAAWDTAVTAGEIPTQTTGVSGSSNMVGHTIVMNGTGGFNTTGWEKIASRLPAQTGNSGKYLSTDGTSPVWATPSGSGGLANRVDAVLAATVAEGTMALSRGARLIKIASTASTRFRLYRTSAQRAADAARALGVDPVGDAVLLEINFVTGTTIWLNPITDIANDDGTFYTLTSATADITLTWEATA